MLEKTFEWLRLVHPDPTDDMVTLRNLIVSGILSRLQKTEDINEACSLASAAFAGLSSSIPGDVKFAETLVNLTREHHPAFPSDLSENALDLQLSSLLAVGELLSPASTETKWRKANLAIAAFATASHQLRPQQTQHHLAKIQSEIVRLAESVLALASHKVRERPQISVDVFETVDVPADAPALWKELKPILRRQLKVLQRAAAIEHDELEVLWWIYNAYSQTFDKRLDDLSAFEIALSAPIELVDRALCPPPPSIRGVIRGLVSAAEKTNDKKGKTLDTAVNAWGSAGIKALFPLQPSILGQITLAPKLMPLTFVASKVEQSGVSDGWGSEFQAKTGLLASAKVTPTILADQLFAERTAQRLLAELQED
jgi:GTPase-associated system helical domain